MTSLTTGQAILLIVLVSFLLVEAIVLGRGLWAAFKVRPPEPLKFPTIDSGLIPLKED